MRTAPARTKGLVIIGATRSDAHVVSVILLAMMLEEAGYEVVNLRCCNPTPDFFSAIPPDRTAAAIVIANQNGCALADLQELPDLLRQHPVPVIVGGHYHVGCGSTDRVDQQLYDLGVSCIATTPEAMFVLLEGLDNGSAPRGAPRRTAQSVAP
jgi:methylmalonyl-CoA mutase cobalamin-binding subunit